MSNEKTQTDQGSEDMLEIPANVMVPCPLAHPRLTRVDKCPACPHFVGLGDRFGETSKHPFAVRFMVRCGHPRSLALVETEA